MNEYSGFISITALAVSALSGLYLNSKIEALSQRVTSHDVQLQDIRAQISDTGKQSKQAFDIGSKNSEEIYSLRDDISATSFQACGPEFILPSQERQNSYYGGRSGGFSRGRISRPGTPMSPRTTMSSHVTQNLTAQDLATRASQMQG